MLTTGNLIKKREIAPAIKLVLLNLPHFKTKYLWKKSFNRQY